MRGSYCLVFFLFLIGCANVDYRGEQKGVLQDISSSKFNEAYKKSIDPEFLNEKESILLRRLEQGTLAYYSGSNYVALKYFDEAYSISMDLYTKSLKNKILAGLDENHDVYYGLPYEIALIRFYQSVLHYKIFLQQSYEEGEYATPDRKIIKIKAKKLTVNEARNHLFASRSVIMDWDNFNNQINEKHRYIDAQTEILLKTWGSFVHSKIGTRDDKRIAIDLLKNAKELLNTRLMMLSSFNTRSEQWYLYLKNNSSTDIKDRERFVNKTNLTTALEKHIDDNIEMLQKNDSNNVSILIFSETLPLKTADKILFLDFPDGILLNIRYETLDIKSKPLSKAYALRVKDKNNVNISHHNPSLIAPLTDVAFASINNTKQSVNLKAHGRVAAKVASYLVVANSSEGDQLAVLGAKLAMLAAIDDQKVDTRQWLSLPAGVFMANLSLPNGKYTIELEDITTGKVVQKKAIEVKEKDVLTEFFNF